MCVAVTPYLPMLHIASRSVWADGFRQHGPRHRGQSLVCRTPFAAMDDSRRLDGTVVEGVEEPVTTFPAFMFPHHPTVTCRCFGGRPWKHHCVVMTTLIDELGTRQDRSDRLSRKLSNLTQEITWRPRSMEGKAPAWDNAERHAVHSVSRFWTGVASLMFRSRTSAEIHRVTIA